LDSLGQLADGGYGSSSVRAPGGKNAIAAVVDDFVARCAKDGRINGKFAKTDIPRLKKMLIDQVCEATGGPAPMRDGT